MMYAYEPRQTFSSMGAVNHGKNAPMPKTLSYATNGTGRDNYIGFNNGGLTVAHSGFKAPEIGTFYIAQKRTRTRDSHPAIHAKNLHYHSDGTGRDSYVVTTSGGLHVANSPGSHKATFYNTLRSYSRPSTASTPRRTGMSKDPFASTQSFTSTKHSMHLQSVRTYQKSMDDRLSAPKRYNHISRYI